MAYLVSGGYGHIGSWVCQDLLSRGQEVIVLGRSRRRLSYLEGLEDGLSFVPADILDHASLWRLMKEHAGRIKGIVHIAGLMGGPLFATRPQHHIKINTMGTVAMLEAARSFGVAKLVYISSGAVYGPRDDVPAEEEPMAPGDLYGAAKASAEMFGLQYANEFGLDFRAVRVYFAYGPGRLPSELYPLYQAVFGPLEGRRRIELPAGRDQSIDFTYIRDIARGICLVLEAPALAHRQYNLTSGAQLPIPELINLAAEQAEVEVDLDIGPGRIMPRGPSLDSSRIREELGFAPQYDLVQGLAEYLAWIEQA